MDKIFNMVVDEFVGMGIKGGCITSSIILCEILKEYKLNAEIVYGFINVSRAGYSAFHVWVRCGGKILDPGSIIIERTMDVNLEGTVSETALYRRIDMETKEEKETYRKNLTMVLGYLKNKQSFWDSCPKYVEEVNGEIRKKMKKLSL